MYAQIRPNTVAVSQKPIWESGQRCCCHVTGNNNPTTTTAPGTAYPNPINPVAMRVARSFFVLKLYDNTSANATASSAVMSPNRRLFNAQSMNRAHGTSRSEAIKGLSINSTGNTNPKNRGRAHQVLMPIADRPVKEVGCASDDGALDRRLEKRIRACAIFSSCSNTRTVPSNKVANCAAAIRLSMTNQAL